MTAIALAIILSVSPWKTECLDILDFVRESVKDDYIYYGVQEYEECYGEHRKELGWKVCDALRLSINLYYPDAAFLLIWDIKLRPRNNGEVDSIMHDYHLRSTFFDMVRCFK